jgi:hypothetical protein
MDPMNGGGRIGIDGLPQSSMVGPDFSDVDSIAKALALVEKGVLEPLLLLPPEFGGSDIPQNRLYVPNGLAAIKHSHDQNVIRPLVLEGLIREYGAYPDYDGRSVVPLSLFIRAWEPREVAFTLGIWGEGLEKPAKEETSEKRPWWKFW